MGQTSIIGNSLGLRKVIELADEYGSTDWPVLILGETGVGKELIARRILEKSKRSYRPYVPVNAGAFPTGLFESEFFGYEKGAYTGAVSVSRGLLRQADGGTLFLDEIGDLDMSVQVKLLRLLDQGEIRSVGSTRTEKIDVRMIAATNVDLYSVSQQGKFRRDLLERLSVLTIEIPALRERAEDIVALARFFLDGLGAKVLSQALDPLLEFAWPGNIRQLRNVCIRMNIQGKGECSLALTKRLVEEERLRSSVSSVKSDMPLADIEREVIVDRLRRCHGNRKQAAKELGIAKSTLHEKIKRWRSEPHEAEIPAAFPMVAARFLSGPQLQY